MNIHDVLASKWQADYPCPHCKLPMVRSKTWDSLHSEEALAARPVWALKKPVSILMECKNHNRISIVFDEPTLDVRSFDLIVAPYQVKATNKKPGFSIWKNGALVVEITSVADTNISNINLDRIKTWLTFS